MGEKAPVIGPLFASEEESREAPGAAVGMSKGRRVLSQVRTSAITLQQEAADGNVSTPPIGESAQPSNLSLIVVLVCPEVASLGGILRE